MKVIVATSSGQGRADGDYCWTIEGELVRVIAYECCSPDQCGCGRAFAGLGSSRSTTTASVAERDMTLEDLQRAVHDGLHRDGWLCGLDPDEVNAEVANQVAAITYVAATYPNGTVLRRRGTLVFDGVPRTV